MFLDYFGLKRLDELPPLSELKDFGELDPQFDFDAAPIAANADGGGVVDDGDNDAGVVGDADASADAPSDADDGDATAADGIGETMDDVTDEPASPTDDMAVEEAASPEQDPDADETASTQPQDNEDDIAADGEVRSQSLATTNAAPFPLRAALKAPPASWRNGCTRSWRRPAWARAARWSSASPMARWW